MKSPVRLERRLDQPRSLSLLVPLLSIAAALVLGGVLLLATGRNPFSVYQRIFERGFWFHERSSRHAHLCHSPSLHRVVRSGGIPSRRDQHRR